MAKIVTIKLSQPIIAHDSPVAQIVIREPNAREYWEHGEPANWSKTEEGVLFRVENDGAIKAYIEACVVEPRDPLLLGQLCLADGMAVKEAMLGFFSEARTKNSTTSSTSSSSASAPAS